MREVAVELIRVERKSRALKPAELACLSKRPTVNLTAGCAHGCVYCYAQGYGTYPGDGKVRLYTNTVAKLHDELRRKRVKPAAVYFSSASDLFQPVPEVLETALAVLRLLFERGIGVAFLTKGVIPDSHLDLLKQNAELVHAQIGLISLDEKVLAMFEPKAASAAVRVEQIETLLAAGIPTRVRLDPILPGITDDVETFGAVCARLARIGVRRIAASVLFLRPAIAAAVRRHASRRPIVWPTVDALTSRLRLTGSGSRTSVRVLSARARETIYDRLRAVARSHGIDVRVCGCKNSDLVADFGTDPCGLEGQWNGSHLKPRQLMLFDINERRRDSCGRP